MLSFSKSPIFLHSYTSQESAETDKYIGDFAKLRVIERVAYKFKTLAFFLRVHVDCHVGNSFNSFTLSGPEGW